LPFVLHVRKEAGARATKEKPVLEESRPDATARLRAAIEEELGAFRRFADVPSVEIEAMAARLTRAIEPFLAVDDRRASRAA
jgi:hypothetical protein